MDHQEGRSWDDADRVNTTDTYHSWNTGAGVQSNMAKFQKKSQRTEFIANLQPASGRVLKRFVPKRWKKNEVERNSRSL
jgi:hypothetical protein